MFDVLKTDICRETKLREKIFALTTSKVDSSVRDFEIGSGKSVLSHEMQCWIG